MVPQRQDFHGVINLLLLEREYIVVKEVENADANSISRQGRRAKARVLRKTSVDGLLIKISKSGGLWVDAKVLDQGME